ncbi:SMC domain protein [Reticulomyxa filosa]|uniref:SMC domain protein n=1 Tax=Reticulomyxa filosa TaxID=46433 RepID=X6M7L3_RETFI|nr:SMC domain protein [Reticulomyxa filosa]|eukprot:ETO09025.1 SMC domain protein [Reticulomyxa filosa]
MHRSKWIEERQEERGDNLMGAIKEKLMLHLCELKQSSKCLELDIDHPDHLEQGRKIVEHLEKLSRLESIIPEIADHSKEVGMKIEYAIRATVSTIEHEFSLEKRNVRYQKEIKGQLEKLKECIKNSKKWSQDKELKDVQDLKSQIQSTENKLRVSERSFQEKSRGSDHEIQRVEDSISRLKDIIQHYQGLNSSWLIFRDPTKAIDYLKEQGYQSIEDIKNKEEEEEEILDKLKKQVGELEKSQNKEMEELKRELKKYQEIQKEYQKEKESVILETTSKFLKNRDFSDSEILELINDETFLFETIQKYEREISSAKGVSHVFDILNPSRTEKILHYLKECKAAPFSFTDIVAASDQRGEKRQSTLKQDLVAALHLVEHYLQCYGEFVQSQLRSLDYTEISSTSKTNANEFMEKVETIVNRLNEINKLKKIHPVIFAFFPQDMIKQFLGKLEKIWFNLSNEMMKYAKQSNFQALNNRISATKALIMLDDYAKPDCKFRNLFLTYQEALFNNVIDTGKVLKAMEEHRYINVAAEMSKINQRKDGDEQAEKST